MQRSGAGSMFDKPFYNSAYSRPLQNGPLTMNGFGIDDMGDPGLVDTPVKTSWVTTAANILAKTKTVANKAKEIGKVLRKRPAPAITPALPGYAPAPASGIFGMPTMVVVVGGVALAGGIAYLVLKKR